MKEQQSQKMRIRLYDPKGMMMEDRLITQSIAFTQGPKAVHEGPMSLEFNLADKEDAQGAITFLQKITGVLPLKTKKVKITHGTVTVDDKEPLEDLYKVLLDKCETQEGVILAFREQGFKFVTSDVLTEVVPELKDNIKLKEKHKKYQFMIRQIKEAMDPTKDRYDWRLLIGIKVIGTKIPKVVVYLFGKFKTKKTIEWGKVKNVNFKKVDKLMIFPEFMDYDDRKKWRNEHRRLANKPDLTPTKFYEKYKPHVTFKGA